MLKAKASPATVASIGAAVALVVAAAAAPALADSAAVAVPSAASATLPADPCGPAPLFQPLAEPGFFPTSPADGWTLDGLELAAPPFFRRTCRCSCGYPCQTDADCGPGGICSAGITCCAAPEEGWRLDGVELAKPPSLRTCVCSCGYPCKTDADCGPGGQCGPGITCCAVPPRNEELTPAGLEPVHPAISDGAVG